MHRIAAVRTNNNGHNTTKRSTRGFPSQGGAIHHYDSRRRTQTTDRAHNDLVGRKKHPPLAWSLPRPARSLASPRPPPSHHSHLEGSTDCHGRPHVRVHNGARSRDWEDHKHSQSPPSQDGDACHYNSIQRRTRMMISRGKRTSSLKHGHSAWHGRPVACHVCSPRHGHLHLTTQPSRTSDLPSWPPARLLP